MELPQRPKGNEYTKAGRYRELQAQVRRRLDGQDIPALFVYAFDFRTRLGPFLFVDKKLIPGAPQAVGAALDAAGFDRLRLVLQQWTPNLRPSQALLDGDPPEMLLVSSMQIHAAAAYDLIRDAWRLGDDRPLIVAGGAKAIYEPWDFFGLSPDGCTGADVVVTGEEFVMLELMDRILQHKSETETMRGAFERVRREGLLEDIPGLVYRSDDAHCPPEYLINTGVQQLVQDLDELPSPLDALGLFEAPHRRSTLSRHPIPLERLKRHAGILPTVTTRGCKFHCPYCPIPAYNQFTFRFKSPDRLVEEMARSTERTGINSYFGTDDNFFNNRQTVEETLTAMARGTVHGKPFRDSIFFGTEGTEFDVFKQQDLLPLARDAGLRAIWFGIEDMTAELVKKGQSPEKTEKLIQLLLDHGIASMPMMIHHDGQPVWSRGSLYGLLNQTHYLRRAGALSFQVTFLTPTPGSKGYEDPFRDGMVMGRVGGKSVDDYQYDGNHCVASHDPHPWRKQLNMLASYAYFYNPLNLFRAALTFDSLWAYRVGYQMYGNRGVVKSLVQASDWIRRLVSGPIERLSEPPRPKFPMVVPDHVDAKLAHWCTGIDTPLPGPAALELAGCGAAGGQSTALAK